MSSEPTAAATYDVLKRVGQCFYRSNATHIYYAILKRGRKQIKRSLKTTDQALAKRRLAELRDKAGRLAGEDRAKINFAALAQQWLPIATTSVKETARRRMGTLVKSLEKYFGAMTVRSITERHVEQWAMRRTQEAAARTFNMELQCLSRVFRLAIREGVILDNPARTVNRMKVTKAHVVIPSREQFNTLLHHLREQGKRGRIAADFCEFLAYSGCRLAEALAVTWGDINMAQKTFAVTGGVYGTKNHESRTVPLFPALEKYFPRLKQGLGQEPATTDRLFNLTGVQYAINLASRSASLPHFTHHSLRHFFCSNAIEAGIDFKAIAGWLGHKDGGLLVARTYGHLRDEHSMAMAQRMTFAAG